MFVNGGKGPDGPKYLGLKGNAEPRLYVTVAT